MEYFTIAWWKGETDDEAYDPNALYRERFSRIKEYLPSSLISYCKNLSLHDSTLNEIEVNIPENSIAISTTTWDKSGSEMLYILHYGHVEKFVSRSDYKQGLPGPHGYGDWGYDEVDTGENGTFIHRVLFSSGITIEINFKKFSIEMKPVQQGNVLEITSPA